MARPTLRQVVRALAATRTPMDQAEELVGVARRRRSDVATETTAERARRERQQFAEDIGLDASYATERREAELVRRLGWDVAPPPELDDNDE